MPKNSSQPKIANKNRIKNSPGKASGKNPFASLLISVLSGTASLFISAFLMSYLIEKSPDPNAYVMIAAILSTTVSAAVAGITSSKMTCRPAPWSILSGLVMVLVYLLISVFFDSGEYENSMLFKTATMILLPVSAFVAGSAASRKKRRTRKGK